MRGTPGVRQCRGAASGIIPACAGNTSVRDFRASEYGDHPRVCGEHGGDRCHREGARGSSPRVRGTHAASCARMSAMGIIPACAGNTWRACRCGPRTRDHPRVCGEHRSSSSNGMIAYRDHPRVCGEHGCKMAYMPGMMGSSPRVRGTLGRRAQRRRIRGIIPACAGNTLRAGVLRAHLRDHPRVCGEHPMGLRQLRRTEGSSPRVRGTLARRLLQQALRGIIPACAGNTGAMPPSASSARDHPRVCGEHMTGFAQGLNTGGSSPRVRGTPSSRRRRSPPPGIIPACAGNTHQV